MTPDGDTSPVRDYLLLGLRLGRLVDGFVDSWFGDPALSRRVEAEPRPDPADLARQAVRVRSRLAGAGLAPARRRFLSAQLTALECSARRLAGTEMPFTAEVEAYFDVQIGLNDPDVYAAAHKEIAELLPGTGDARDRLVAFHDRDRVPADLLGTAIRALAEGLRSLVHAEFGPLPDDEGVEFTVTTGKPWNAFNLYRGGYRSLVTINADSRHGMSALPLLAAHECYPGHHTEHCVKEAGLVRAHGQDEQAIALVNTPQCLIAEGLGETAMAAVLGDGWGAWTAEILAGCGLRLDGDLAERLLPLTTRLLAARQDAAIMLHDRGAEEEEVIAYLRRWMLVTDERARHMVRFLTDPLWRAYTVTYIEGTKLVRAWLSDRTGDGSVTGRYRRLLSEPLLPSQLRDELESGGGPGGAAATAGRRA